MMLLVNVLVILFVPFTTYIFFTFIVKGAKNKILTLIGANRENGNFRTLSVLCQVEVVEVDAAASENAKIDPNLT